MGVVDLKDFRLPVYLSVSGTNRVAASLNSHNAFSNKLLF